VTRKVSVDSVGDTSADDLLRFLYDLTFRQTSLWGWVLAAAFAAVPAWLAIVCLLEDNIVGGIVLATLASVIPCLRYYRLYRHRLPLPQQQELPASKG
jgi:hypothetical protein